MLCDFVQIQKGLPAPIYRIIGLIQLEKSFRTGVQSLSSSTKSGAELSHLAPRRYIF